MSGVLRRTELGNRSLQEREVGKRLPARLRSLLLQVDGSRDAAALQLLASSLGLLPDSVDELLAQGLVEAVPATLAESLGHLAALAQVVPHPAPAATLPPSGPAAPRPLSEREMLLAALSQTVSEVSSAPAMQENAAQAAPVQAAPADAGLMPPKLQAVRDKMLGVATMITGQLGVGIRQQLADCNDAASLHTGFAALRLALKKGYKGDDSERLLEPIRKMLPPLPKVTS